MRELVMYHGSFIRRIIGSMLFGVFLIMPFAVQAEECYEPLAEEINPFYCEYQYVNDYGEQCLPTCVAMWAIQESDPDICYHSENVGNDEQAGFTDECYWLYVEETKDSLVCDLISDAAMKLRCEEEFSPFGDAAKKCLSPEAASEKNRCLKKECTTQECCDYTSPGITRSTCYAAVAGKTDDLDLCILSEQLTCLESTLSGRTDNTVSICDAFEGNDHASCISKLAGAEGDATICLYAKEESKQNACVERRESIEACSL